MVPLITLTGIDQAISNLNYSNSNILKGKLVCLIRQSYTDDRSVEFVESISPSELIKTLWDTGDDYKSVKNKTKNFNCLKSSLNADLQRLYHEGKNPEGILIGTDNTFEMSQDAKDKILDKFGFDLKPDGNLSLDQMMNVLKMATETLSGSLFSEDVESADGLKKLDQLKGLLQNLSQKVDLAAPEPAHADSGIAGTESFSGATGDIGVKDRNVESENPATGDNSGASDVLGEDSSQDFLPGDTHKDDSVGNDAIDAGEQAAGSSSKGVPSDTVKNIDELEEDESAGGDEQFEALEEDEFVEDLEAAEDFEADELVEELEVAEDLAEDEIVEEFEAAGGLEKDEAADDLEVAEPLEPEELVEDFEEGDDIEYDEFVKDIEGTPQAAQIDEAAATTEDRGENEADRGADVLQDTGLDDASEPSGIKDELGGVGMGEVAAGRDLRGSATDREFAADSNITDADDQDSVPSGEVESADVPETEDATVVDEVDDLEPVEVVDDDDVEELQGNEMSGALEAVEEVEDEEVVEDLDAAEELENDEVVEGLDAVEEVEDDEIVEALDTVEELEDDEVVEDLDAVEDVEDDEIIEDFDSVEDLEEGQGTQAAYDVGLPAGSLGHEYSQSISDNIKNNRLLAEEFDGCLGAMDRYFNHYTLISDGKYVIGSSRPNNNEKSEQCVDLAPFYMGRFPITNGLFEIFVEKTGYKTFAEKIGFGTVYYGRFQKKKDQSTGLITATWNASLHCQTVEGACWYQPLGPGSTLHNKRSHPVVQVTIDDAMAFSAWTGKRLPTEEEWEAASRTANGRVYPWGQEWQKDYCNIEDSCVGDTTPVDRYVEFENDYGIVDSMGNVLEWTLSNSGSTSNEKDSAVHYIAKGGSWISGNEIKLFNRFKLAPESHSNILGFRCAAS